MNLELIEDRATTEGRDLSWASGQFESSGIQLLSAQAKGAAAFGEGKPGSRDSCTAHEDIVSLLKKVCCCVHNTKYLMSLCSVEAWTPRRPPSSCNIGADTDVTFHPSTPTLSPTGLLMGLLYKGSDGGFQGLTEMKPVSHWTVTVVVLERSWRADTRETQELPRFGVVSQQTRVLEQSR